MTKKKVLVIDDDADILESIKIILEVSGFEAVIASNSKDGLKLFASEKPDFILCDMMMERIDEGMYIAREIRSSNSEIPMYLLSSIGDATVDSIDFSKIDFNGVFQKPVDPDTMLDVIRKHISN